MGQGHSLGGDQGGIGGEELLKKIPIELEKSLAGILRLLHASFLRSNHAPARIRAIDVGGRGRAPGWSRSKRDRVSFGRPKGDEPTCFERRFVGRPRAIAGAEESRTDRVLGYELYRPIGLLSMGICRPSRLITRSFVTETFMKVPTSSAAVIGC
jgi:hypothetical protein